jgi:hypothetical protein
VKNLLWITLGLLLTTAVAALAMRQFTGKAHGRELLVAGGITLVSALVSMIPLTLAVRASASAVTAFQAAFGGTVLHLMLTLAMGAVAYSMKVVDRGMFLFLLLGFYWFSLMFVVTAMIKTFRHAAPFRAADQQAKGA